MLQDFTLTKSTGFRTEHLHLRLKFPWMFSKIIWIVSSNKIRQLNKSQSNRIQTHNHLVCKWKLNHLSKLPMIELCCEYLSVQCIWLYVVIMSRMSFRVNSHSIVCLNVKELLARSRHHIYAQILLLTLAVTVAVSNMVPASIKEFLDI